MTNVKNDNQGLQFITERLVIRDHIPSDLEGLASLIQSKCEMHYIMELYAADMEAVAMNLNTAIQAIHATFRDKYFFAILEKETQAYVGEIGFTVLEKDIDAFGFEKPLIVELGYFIKRDFWNKGYVTEAARSVVAFAFESLEVHKIITGCVKENAGSEKVMVHNGFVKEGTLRQHQRIDGVWKDRVVYGYLRTDYQNR